MWRELGFHVASFKLCNVLHHVGAEALSNFPLFTQHISYRYGGFAAPGIADGQRFGRFPTIGYIRVYPTNEFTGQRQNAKRIAIDHFAKPSNHIWGCSRLKSLVGALRTGDAAQRDELTKGGDQLLLCISADAEVQLMSI